MRAYSELRLEADGPVLDGGAQKQVYSGRQLVPLTACAQRGSALVLAPVEQTAALALVVRARLDAEGVYKSVKRPASPGERSASAQCCAMLAGEAAGAGRCAGGAGHGGVSPRTLSKT
jgi:hypothetical protein